MSRLRDRSYLWVFYTAAGFLFAGTVLRTLLEIDDGGVLLKALLLLLAWLVLFVSETFLSRLWRPWFTVYLVLETAIVFTLFLLPGSDDFFAVLFAILAMHVLQRYGLLVGAIWVALFVPLTALPLVADYDGPQAAALVLVYTAVNIFLGAYALATRRAAEAHATNQALGRELQAANVRLRDYSSRLERLAVAQERNRLARELHDSVTQTIFSMTLASQSAAILLEREPTQVDAQLERLGQLTQSALAEMHVLISELTPDVLAEGDLPTAIRKDIQRRAPDGVRVSLEVDEPQRGVAADGELSDAEKQGLLRIAQEALNNVAKHSGASEATIRLCLKRPFRMEIEDHGQGFDAQRAQDGPGIGLASMSERAAEIGWDLDVESSIGKGTKVVVERRPLGEAAHDGG